ncbi:4'-phosphopantetheinyl transferase superfamily protein [uncultured Thiodictyon sp.]|uniref:4'-phosphopantetheinyl transferase family protein n=1 Tax=uncultured Thiodictyon sp. TaxID=1846217 RepID=UPI0025DA2DC4|nr:4'-phosphopantetheinyl transferase superfamily protein [uncultured Thiodictyon sp.]
MHDLIHWQPNAAAPAIAPGGLHLWHLSTDARGDDPDSCLALLGERQRRRALGLTHAGFRERYIRAQAGLRRVLGLYLDIPPRAVGFTYGPAGKPAVAQALGALEFNLTTTGDLALIAISRGGEVGIDCEWLRPRRDLVAIARRVFTADEVATLLAAPEAARLDYFYHAWTALEADAKADGRGLFRSRAPAASPPQIRHCIPAPGHIAAVARAQLPPREEWLTLDLLPLGADALP